MVEEDKTRTEEEKPLPVFRSDLEVYQGPDDPDGGPTYNIYDPVKGQYYKISWKEATVLQTFQPGMTLSQLLRAINTASTLQVSKEEVETFLKDAISKNLMGVPQSADRLHQEASQRKQSRIKWLLTQYLYVRVPLVNPDRFLRKTLPFVRLLGSAPAIIIYVTLSLLGLIGTLGRLDEFLYTFPYFFNLEGILVYVLAILAVKFVHEFSHAYIAAHYNVTVPSMGIAFIVMWPCCLRM